MVDRRVWLSPEAKERVSKFATENGVEESDAASALIMGTPIQVEDTVDEEIKHLKRDKLAEEVKLLHLRRITWEKRLPMAIRNSIELEKDTAQPEAYWCKKCRVTAETPEEIAAHRANGCEPYMEVYR